MWDEWDRCDEKTLRHCLRVAETFGKDEIVSATRRQLTWTHIKTLAYVSDALKRHFYLEMCVSEHWGTRALQNRIGSMMYERTAIAKRSEAVIKRILPNCAMRERCRQTSPSEIRMSSTFLVGQGAVPQCGGSRPRSAAHWWVRVGD